MICFRTFRTIHRNHIPLNTFCVRYLNSSETATALRPFYFAVHPDLFGRYPKERAVNEDSLKKLHEYVASLQSQRSHHVHATNLNFYVRNQEDNQTFRKIRITLKSTDIRVTVSAILKACGLPLDYVNSVPATPHKTQFKVEWITGTSQSTHFRGDTWSKPAPPKTLGRWLLHNQERVRKYVDLSQQTDAEISSLTEEIVARVGVTSVRWQNIWGNRHYIACLRSFNQMSQTQLVRMRNTMKGRSLVFGNDTGVNLHGEVVLGSEDVPTEWMMLLKSVHAYDPMIARLPLMEQELSALLNNIRIMRRETKEFIMAQTYEVLLNKMLNSLRRCQDVARRELGAQDLSHLVLMVESESGPLALSNGGHFLIPASIPGPHMVKFILENKDQAATFLIDAKYHTFYMDQILEQCHDVLNVSQITRDDAITPQQMTTCCQRLLDNRTDINPLLQGTKLKVATYYTVMRDGELTIPWDWQAD